MAQVCLNDIAQRQKLR